jgi:hypothetical protein
MSGNISPSQFIEQQWTTFTAKEENKETTPSKTETRVKINIPDLKIGEGKEVTLSSVADKFDENRDSLSLPDKNLDTLFDKKKWFRRKRGRSSVRIQIY